MHRCLYKKSRGEKLVVEAVELWKTRRGFSKPCGKAALPKGWLSIGRQIHSWVRRGAGGGEGKSFHSPVCHDLHAAAALVCSIRSRCRAMSISLSYRASVVMSL